MVNLTPYMRERLGKRERDQEKRFLPKRTWRFDFASNDYLGFARSPLLRERILRSSGHMDCVGATGSRLLTGNMELAEDVEGELARFFGFPSALIFSSGFALNCGLLAALCDADDAIVMDENVHASFKNGLKLAKAPGYFFRHNDLMQLEDRLQRLQTSTRAIFVVVESLYSMDGDMVALPELLQVCERYDARLIIDEAHAIGACGQRGRGLVESASAQERVFACVVTFGKAFGCHAGALLGSPELVSYVQNFCHSFIYTTGLPSFSLLAIREALALFAEDPLPLLNLQKNIKVFNRHLGMGERRASPIYSFPFADPCRLRAAAKNLQEKGYGILPIYSPTVRKGSERLRVSVHAHNTESELLGCANELGAWL